MPKSLTLQKEKLRKKQNIVSRPIAVNAYVSNLQHEQECYGNEKLRMAYYDMLVIREFEQMLNEIKTQERYRDISYRHLGPAHLSTGQESSAVGQCMELEKDDLIFGSHRSHGEIIAKCFSTLRQLSEEELMMIMEKYRNGIVLRAVEQKIKTDSIYDLAEYYVLYGLLAEIFACETGFNAGLGGSMHAFFVPFGSMPNNAIVGGSADIAVGSALYKKVNRKQGIVIANIGDAAMACGPVWEALVFASMDQYKFLWEENKGAPPFLLNVYNNFYGMGGQTRGETMGMGIMARIASGLNAQSLYAERVDGFNPLAVADAMRRKKKLLYEGKGPILLDTITYRFAGHSPSDASSYRTKEEVEHFRVNDPIEEYQNYLLTNNLLSEELLENFAEDCRTKIVQVLKMVVDAQISPKIQAESIENYMFSRKRINSEAAKDCLIPLEENPRVRQIAQKKRYAFDENKNPHSQLRLYTFRDAIFEAVIHAAYSDASLVIYGEENRDWGGAFGCYQGLTESLPYHRLFNSPIAEAAIVGTAVGYALSGGRALVELMYCDFLGRAGDEVFNQMPKWQGMSASELQMPMVLRLSIGNKYGAQHSQDWTAMLAHISGLVVMYPATPYDAKGMLTAALNSTDPVVFVESQKLYSQGEIFFQNGVPTETYEIPLGEPVLRRSGKDLSIITLGPALYPALKAVEKLEEEYKLGVDLIDLRFVNPLDYELLLDSVKKTGKVLLVSDAAERGSTMHTVADTISANVFDYLDAPPKVLGARNWICPPAELEDAYFPTMQAILDAVDQNLIELPGHHSSSLQSNSEYLRRNKFGV